MLTVAQNTQMAHLLIIPEVYSVYLVIFQSLPPLRGALSVPRVLILKSVHPIASIDFQHFCVHL